MINAPYVKFGAVAADYRCALEIGVFERYACLDEEFGS